MRRLTWVALFLVACSAQPRASAGSPSTGSTTPSPWSCRLPVIAGSVGQGSGPQQAGFLSLPSSGFSFSPAAAAGDGMFYDRPLKRWVPWAPPALSDDGSSYAYVDGDSNSSRVHLVDVRTDRDIVLAEGGPWRVVGLQPDAVYVMRIEYLPYSEAYGVMAVGRGLWRVPLKGGVPVQLTGDSRNWPFVGAGAAWGEGSTFDVGGGPNDVVRLDLRTLQLTTWFAPGKRSRVLAIDASGVPLIMSEAAAYELWRVAAPDGAVKVWSAAPGATGPYSPAAVDGSVVWFSSTSLTPSWSIYRYSASRGLELVANFSDHPVSVAGPCA
jgi:hypothetical protein